MDRIVLIGLNHKTAPVDIREKFADICVDGAAPLEQLSRIGRVKEVLFVSTCNRMEVLFTTPTLEKGIGVVVRFLADVYGQTSSNTSFGWHPAWIPWWWANLRYWARSNRPTGIPWRPRPRE
jgi:glutamyl-tRNA reductase